MAQLVWTNNANSTLTVAINTSATSVTLATGTGNLFPNPGLGQYFVFAFFNQTNNQITEICWCTGRSGDVLTIVRAQEGTTALSWSLNDLVIHDITAGQMSALVQEPSGYLYTAAASLTAPALININSSQEIQYATDVSGLPAQGFIVQNVTASGTVEVFFFGAMQGLTSLTPGRPVYLGPTGTVTQTQPGNGSGLYEQIVGYANTTTSIIFNPGPLNGPM